MIGWDDFFSHIERSNNVQSKILAEAKKVQKEIDKRAKNQIASFSVTKINNK